MKRAILTTFFLACTSNAISQPLELPRALSNGNVADADEVMANFNALKDGVNTRMSVDLTTYNTAIGNGLKSVTPGTPDASSGTLNTASGIGALYSNTRGYLNTAVGLNGLYTNSAGSFNSAFGNGALYLNEDGSYNTAIGSRAAYSNTSGSHVVAVGREALYSNTIGDGNTGIGFQALSTNSGGSSNTAIGYWSLKNNTGSDNTAVGSDALIVNSSGARSAAFGVQALASNTTGERNTAVGFMALVENIGGSRNTAIGYAADVSSENLENATAIGYNTKVNADNKVRIGNLSVQYIEGQVPFSQSSDARLKEDITSVDAGLALVNDLNPVSYHRINSSSDDIEMGLLAQEVEEVLAAHGLSNSGMVHQASEDAYRSVRYNDLLAPMIRAIQELDDAAETKDQQITSLQEQLTEQQGSLLSMIAAQQEQIAQLQRMVEHQFVAR